ENNSKKLNEIEDSQASIKANEMLVSEDLNDYIIKNLGSLDSSMKMTASSSSQASSLILQKSNHTLQKLLKLKPNIDHIKNIS
ncbi:hypothetical protein RhiirC2_798039, partial [Rhizophagus irregularis]